MTSRPDDGSSRERILAAATRLFAERGYDATSTRAIGEAVGLNIATVAYHVGGKAELYRAVMRRAHLAQREVVTEALGQLHGCGTSAGEARTALLGFVDAYLSFCLNHPEVPALWMRRWLSERADLAEIESEFAGPLVAEVAAAVREVLERADIGAGVDVEMLVFTIVWTAHSFGQAGVIDPAGRRLGPRDLAVLDRFRRHLHTVVEGVLDRAG
ncbi:MULTISPECIES: TetR/AcrR family transcriptional regulator [unclassified Streptomyces]|uniref:TetR/AcrR family transcriptional regulator n=1 Tax=unclassified Streptomyces TaxID=2593676 RepID=UPI0016609122|nr:MULTISPECIES: TetR/AcrR family transcriptional regulator [unclassified Streptomyces]MBD0710794.1 TetR family transcriptional regulator [Streptomyces sp. CBMA291]MBD0718147.1 TetR family transcriptional regulator [Streptomyces sp. CBMA370]